MAVSTDSSYLSRSSRDFSPRFDTFHIQPFFTSWICYQPELSSQINRHRFVIAVSARLSTAPLYVLWIALDWFYFCVFSVLFTTLWFWWHPSLCVSCAGVRIEVVTCEGSPPFNLTSSTTNSKVSLIFRNLLHFNRVICDSKSLQGAPLFCSNVMYQYRF